MNKLLYNLTFIFLVLLCLGFIKPVFALYINEPQITGVEYVNDSSVKILYKTNNTNPNYKVQIYNMTNGKYYSNSITSTDYTLTGLTTGKTYNIIMRVYYSTSVSEWSNVMSVTPKEGVPVINSVTVGDKQLTLNYNANGSPKEVEIYITNLKKSVKSNNLSSATITGLTNGTTYTFLMRNCYSNYKCSGWSTSKSGVPKATPAPAPSGQQYTYNSSTGYGYGPVKSISLKWKTNSGANNRCGKGKKDYCAARATVNYQYKTITYYVGYQNNSGLLGGSCRSHAFMAVANGLNNTYYSTLDLQKYLKKQKNSVGHNGVLKGKAGFTNAMSHYNLKGKLYFNSLTNAQAKSLIPAALKNGQPVMIFVAHNKCSDLAGTHHALLLLGYDKNGKVIHVDSVPYSKKRSGKRTVSQLVNCMSSGSVANNYYRMIIFSVK